MYIVLMYERGTVLIGKYRVERELARGGVGMIVLAHHLDLDQPVALKLLRPEMLGKPIALQRFIREAQASVRLKSEHVVRVFDVGTLDCGSPFMVLEYMEGDNLRGLLEDKGPFSTYEAVDYMLQACQALAEAHALGIVHRDIKPSNIFLTRRADGSPLIKVLDFGIAKAPSAKDIAITGNHAFLGTPSYMSPEQIQSSKSVDVRTDIWSLGAVLYHLLTGKRPFHGNSLAETCRQVMELPVPELPDSFPSGLAEVVARCLKKNPAERYQDVAELAQALAPYASSPAQALMAAERVVRVLEVGDGSQVMELEESSDVHTRPPSTIAGTLEEVVVEESVPVRMRRRGRWRNWLGLGFGAVGVLCASLAAYIFVTHRVHLGPAAGLEAGGRVEQVAAAAPADEDDAQGVFDVLGMVRAAMAGAGVGGRSSDEASNKESGKESGRAPGKEADRASDTESSRSRAKRDRRSRSSRARKSKSRSDAD